MSFATAGLTVAELKLRVANWPETDASGNPIEIWLHDVGRGLAAPCTDMCIVRMRRDGVPEAYHKVYARGNFSS